MPNQVINGEFFKPDLAWSLTSDKITKEFVYGSESISGASMLKLTVPDGTEGQLYQQTIAGTKKKPMPPGRTLLHLMKGQTYRISFAAKSQDGKGRMKIMLKNAKNMDLIYDSYDADNGWIEIGSEPSAYARLYTHNADDHS